MHDRIGALLSLVCAVTASQVLLAQQAVSQNANAADWVVFNEAQVAAIPGLTGVYAAHQYSTPLDMVQAAAAYTGANARMRRVVADLTAGREVTVVAIGGVATNGTAASRPGSNDYLAQYVSFLRAAFPKATISAERRSAGVAPSAVVASCLDRYLPTGADLVLLEMTSNDGTDMDDSIVRPYKPLAYESLVRSALSQQGQPAVLLLHTLAPGMGNGTRGYYLTPEAPQYAAIQTYYDVPALSLRNALWEPSAARDDGTVRMTSVRSADGAVPLDAGHDALVDILAYHTQEVARDLALLPYGSYDSGVLAAPLPKSMYSYGPATDSTLLNITCSYLHNISVMDTGSCPASSDSVCNLDWSSTDSLHAAFLAGAVPTAPVQDGQDGSGSSSSSSSSSGLSSGALIAIIVCSVVGGLLLIGLLVWCCVRSARKRRDAAYAERPHAASAAPPSEQPLKAGATTPSSVPITATSTAITAASTTSGSSHSEVPQAAAVVVEDLAGPGLMEPKV